MAHVELGNMIRFKLNLARQDSDLFVLHPKPEKGRHHSVPLILPYRSLEQRWTVSSTEQSAN